LARRQAFLHAAREVFSEQGYEAACVNDVVRMAGGSLATLYAQFGNKEGLFLAVAQNQHVRVLAAMTPECVDHLPLEQGLNAIGRQFLRALLSRDSLALFRVIIGEGRKLPPSVKRYINTGADNVRAVVADFLRARAAEVEDADLAASYFLELVRSRHHYRALADDAYVLSEAEVAGHVEAAVRFFLNGAQR
jgi:AcrR family transcriptional regulator